MGFCQIVYTILLFMSLGIHLGKHGEARGGSYNFFTALVTCAIEFALLCFGGFYG